jgi:hypothetical protein
LSGSDNKLVAFLQRPSADETSETGQMKDQRSGPHHQLVRIETFCTAAAFDAEDPVETHEVDETKKIQRRRRDRAGKNKD